MRNFPNDFSRPPEPLLPAWVFSVLIHAGLIGLLCVALQSPPRGVADAEVGSVGLVLHHANADGGQNDVELFPVKQASAVGDVPQAPALFASAPTNTTAVVQAHAEEPAKQTKPATSTAKSAKSGAKETKPSGSATARPNLTGNRFGAGGGSYAQTSVFGVQGKGSKFVYVFDRSSSMEGRPLAAAKQQLLQSLESLEGIHQFHIIFFNTKTQSFDASGGGRRIAFASDRNKKLAANFVGGITADGGTDRMYALREAIGYAPDVIFFLTDADDPMTPSEMADIARANRKAQAAICVIEFGKNPAPVPNNFLARLAKESGGQYGYVNTTTLQQAGGRSSR
jgi:hypothetical protein